MAPIPMNWTVTNPSLLMRAENGIGKAIVWPPTGVKRLSIRSPWTTCRWTSSVFSFWPDFRIAVNPLDDQISSPSFTPIRYGATMTNWMCSIGSATAAAGSSGAASASRATMQDFRAKSANLVLLPSRLGS